MAHPSVLRPQSGELGKAQACHDCRRRKVKCDYRMPTCLRCEKAEIACQGYQRHTRFVNRTPGNLLTPVPDQSRNPPGARGFDGDLPVLASYVRKPIGPPTPFRLHALEILKKLYLPQPSQADIRESSAFSWLPTVCALEGESRALDHSLLAFCVVQVAITKSGSASVDEALQVYTDALQKLLEEIQDDRAGQSDELLATISVLSTCELFVCPTDQAWRAHAQGISDILRIRSGVDASSPTWQSFCSRIRIILLIEALLNSRTRSVTISECRKLMSTSTEHDSFHELLDVASEVPDLLEELNMLIAGRKIVPEQQRPSLFQSSLAVLEKLYDRQQKYRVEKARPLYWVMPSRVHNPADDAYENKLFPFALQFESLLTASQVFFAWGITLQTLCSMINLYQHFFDRSVFSASYDPSKSEHFAGPGPHWNARFPTIFSIKEEADKLARYLCQSIEYCHKMENGTIGPQMTTYGQWILKWYFQQFHCEHELSWCLNIKNMTGPGFRDGIELMGFHESEWPLSNLP
ncbi:hypothetical protein BP6252_06643 [Coleophoma cylindrospora]|uniref:Zn(2)-C6 fungal-type domain-containing protein n=1 Tax=Coleophoma cylindrospora TaxID=1849047 RepID=A0A3D8RNW6_9HELO|nr:hypothetical protein BP6252_06643 [Coleophoma cylindrospora]